MSSLTIDYSRVKTVLSGLQTTLKNNNIEGAYSSLIGRFEESSGEEAEALRELLKAEKKLVSEVDQTLSQLAKSIQFAVNEFKQLDIKGATSVSGGTK